MSNIAMLHELLRHMEWADARVWNAVLGAPAARGDSILRDRLFHIHVVQWGFLHLWLNRPLPEFPDQSKFPDLQSVASWGRQAHEEIAAYMGQVDESALEAAVSLSFSGFFGNEVGA